MSRGRRQTALLLLVGMVLGGLALSETRAQDEGEIPSWFAEPRDALVQAVVERLQSDQPAEAAWAAYLAGRYRMLEVEPELRVLVAHPREWTAEGDECARRSALDALIRMDAGMPAVLLEQLSDRRRLEPLVTILLARDPEANEELFLDRVASEKSREYWLLACNLLAARRTPGLAARLLGGLKIDLEVHVVDPGVTGAGSVGIFGGRWDQIVQVPEGFPPTALYALTTDPEVGSELVAQGLYPVYYRREERKGTRRGWGGEMSRVDLDVARMAYLASLLDTGPDDLGLEAEEHLTVQWSGPEEFRAAVAGERERVLAAYQALVDRLTEAGLVTSEEAASLEPQVGLDVADERTDPTQPLPDLEE